MSDKTYCPKIILTSKTTSVVMSNPLKQTCSSLQLAFGVNRVSLPAGLVRLALVRCKDGSVLLLIRQRNRILAVRLQPLVNLIKVDDPSLARFGTGDFPACKFLVMVARGMLVYSATCSGVTGRCLFSLC